MKEIERKFLVDPNASLGKSIDIRMLSQGYIFNIIGHTLRFRVDHGNGSTMTYKGPTSGITRTEVEWRIPNALGYLLKRIFPSIEKLRGIVPIEGSDLYWEVDSFTNLRYPLRIAEIELPTEDTEFPRPNWLGEEVSYSPEYYNSNLIKKVKHGL